MTRNSLPRITLCALLAVTAIAPSAQGQEASLEDCQKLEQLIDQYRELRRKGGPSKQMDAWKRSLRKSEKAFRAQGCQHYGRL